MGGSRGGVPRFSGVRLADGAPGRFGLVGVLVGVLLLALPSLPKAYIEQRNRIRGLRDGSFKEFLENEQGKHR